MLVVRGTGYGIADSISYEALVNGKWLPVSLDKIKAAHDAGNVIFWNPETVPVSQQS